MVIDDDWLFLWVFNAKFNPTENERGFQIKCDFFFFFASYKRGIMVKPGDKSTNFVLP